MSGGCITSFSAAGVNSALQIHQLHLRGHFETGKRGAKGRKGGERKGRE